MAAPELSIEPARRPSKRILEQWSKAPLCFACVHDKRSWRTRASGPRHRQLSLEPCGLVRDDAFSFCGRWRGYADEVAQGGEHVDERARLEHAGAERARLVGEHGHAVVLFALVEVAVHAAD